MADIALLLEGHVPLRQRCGVSSWINPNHPRLPKYRFALVFLGSRRSDYAEFRTPARQRGAFEELPVFSSKRTRPAARARPTRRRAGAA